MATNKSQQAQINNGLIPQPLAPGKEWAAMTPGRAALSRSFDKPSLALCGSSSGKSFLTGNETTEKEEEGERKYGHSDHEAADESKTEVCCRFKFLMLTLVLTNFEANAGSVNLSIKLDTLS